jgi:hypothetical protein
MVRTWVHTPRFIGLPFRCRVVRPFKAFELYRNAGAFSFFGLGFRPFLTN